MKRYDTIVYGGGLYTSGITGVYLITKNYKKLIDKRIIVITVVLASTDRDEVFTPIVEKSFSKEIIDNIEFFHLRGGIDYNKLGFVHKVMIAMVKKELARKEENELSIEDR